MGEIKPNWGHGPMDLRSNNAGRFQLIWTSKIAKKAQKYPLNFQNFGGKNGGDQGQKAKYGTLHDFACHPCAGAMLIFSVSFQF